jgi:hypothetical protein
MPIERPSVQSLLLLLKCNGRQLSSGTGFVVQTANGHALVTNRHNVTGRHQQTGQPLHPSAALPDTVEVIHNRAGRLGQWVSRQEALYNATGAALWKEHPNLGPQVDCVALPLTQTNDVEFYCYDPRNPGPAVSVRPADVVSVVGFPFGMTAGGACAVWATGFVASEPDIDYGGLPVLLIDCRSRPGQSGSAVIAYRNGGAVAMDNGDAVVFGGPACRFIGIYSGRINDQSDLGIVWKASAVAEVVAAV